MLAGSLNAEMSPDMYACTGGDRDPRRGGESETRHCVVMLRSRPPQSSVRGERVAQELSESGDGRPGLPALIVLMVSVDVKQH